MRPQEETAGGDNYVQNYLDELPSNDELKDLLEQAVTRLENWKLEVERNPNPRMVHVLKNIVAHIESLTRLTETRTRYSYKSLSRQMSILIDEVAKLNIAITDSLMEDDLIDEKEEERINETLRNVVQAALALVRLVQHAFIGRRGVQEIQAIEDTASGE